MDSSTPLPLAQQVLAWLIQALGYEHQRIGPDGVSSSTLKVARRGLLIRRKWKALVAEVCGRVGLAQSAPAVFQGLLREWDGFVSTMRSPPLGVGDRLLPVMRLAVPRLGVRLGAAMALASVMTGKSVAEWEWLSDPLAPGVFRKVLGLVLTGLRPEWNTWKGRTKERGKVTGVDPKTIRRWDDGDVPGPQNVSVIVECVGPRSDAPLRWARAAMVLRTDLEEWVGKEAVDSWRRAVRHVAMSAGPEFAADPRMVPRIAELWCEALAEAPASMLSELLANIVRMADIPATGDTVGTWLRGVASPLAGVSSPSVKDARAVLLLSVLLPHPRLVAAAHAHTDQARALALVTADPRIVLNSEWSWRSLLREVERGGLARRPLPDGSEETVPITDAARGAARYLLAEGSRFIRDADPGHEARSEAATQTLMADVFGIGAVQYAVAKVEADATWPYAVLNREVEKALPDEVVRGIPRLALARARRLATAGDMPGALVLVEALDISAYEPDEQERTDLATLLGELAHWTLDSLYPALRSGLARLARAGMDGSAPSRQALDDALGGAVDQVLASADLFLDSAVRWISPRQVASAPVEAVVLSFPYHVRRDRLLSALGRPALGASRVQSLLDSLIEHATRTPGDGEVYAMLALWQRLGGTGSTWVAEDVDPRCEHLGTAALRDRWLARIQSDLGSP